MALHAGEVGIDDALVMESKEEIFEMNNGASQSCAEPSGHSRGATDAEGWEGAAAAAASGLLW